LWQETAKSNPSWLSPGIYSFGLVSVVVCQGEVAILRERFRRSFKITRFYTTQLNQLVVKQPLNVLPDVCYIAKQGFD
jgi:hypothetical protein